MSYGDPSNHRHTMAPNPDLPELDGTQMRRMLLFTFGALLVGSAIALWVSLYVHALGQTLNQYLHGG